MTQPAWLKKSLTQVGYHETGSNDTKFGRYYGLNNEPWCALFVSWSCATSGKALPVMQPGMKNGYAAVYYGISWAKANGLFRPSWEAEPGDAICYGWDGPTSPPEHQHTGLIVRSGPNGSTGHTVEGNRGDQVGRFTFTVGSDVVLGTIALSKLLAPSRPIHVTPAKPHPQPRPAEHPAHTGPPVPVLTPAQRRGLFALLRRFFGDVRADKPEGKT